MLLDTTLLDADEAVAAVDGLEDDFGMLGVVKMGVEEVEDIRGPVAIGELVGGGGQEVFLEGGEGAADGSGDDFDRYLEELGADAGGSEAGGGGGSGSGGSAAAGGGGGDDDLDLEDYMRDLEAEDAAAEAEGGEAEGGGAPDEGLPKDGAAAA